MPIGLRLRAEAIGFRLGARTPTPFTKHLCMSHHDFEIIQDVLRHVFKVAL